MTVFEAVVEDADPDALAGVAEVEGLQDVQVDGGEPGPRAGVSLKSKLV